MPRVMRLWNLKSSERIVLAKSEFSEEFLLQFKHILLGNIFNVEDLITFIQDKSKQEPNLKNWEFRLDEYNRKRYKLASFIYSIDMR